MSVTLQRIEEAHERIKQHIHETPVISCEKISEIAGCEVLFKCEHLQKTGSFKARGAMNAVAVLHKSGPLKGVVTHSSGNHGQGLAWAASRLHLPCCVVVPANAPQSKIDAMRGYSARIELCGNTIKDRENGCADFARALEYAVVEPFNAVEVIHGQGTIGAEIISQVPDVDAVFLSVGGGGMASGVAKFIGEKRPDVKVFLVEPEGKQLAEYLNSGQFSNKNDTLDTIADGIRVLKVGSHCFPILQKYCTGNVITVSDEEIRQALKLIWSRTKQRVEPAAGVPLAGLIKCDMKKLGVKKAVVILCGGNVDLDFIP